MNDLAARLIKLRNGQPRRAFAEQMGTTESTLRNYEKGVSSPTAEFLRNVCHNLRISSDWLLMGENGLEGSAAMVSPPEALNAIQGCSIQETGNACDVDLIMVPMVEARLSAGHGSLEVSGESDRSYAFRSDFLLRKGNPKNMVLMRVDGDSMQPEIMDGDAVLLDQSKTDIRLGKIFAVGFEDAIYLKRIDRVPGKVILKSTNPAYPPLEIDVQGQEQDLFRVIGQVLWIGREY